MRLLIRLKKWRQPVTNAPPRPLERKLRQDFRTPILSQIPLDLAVPWRIAPMTTTRFRTLGGRSCQETEREKIETQGTPIGRAILSQFFSGPRDPDSHSAMHAGNCPKRTDSGLAVLHADKEQRPLRRMERPSSPPRRSRARGAGVLRRVGHQAAVHRRWSREEARGSRRGRWLRVRAG